MFTNHLRQFLFASGMVTDDDICLLITIHDIPALGFSPASMLMMKCIVIIWMHLNRKVLSGIDELYQKWKFLFTIIAEQFSMLYPERA